MKTLALFLFALLFLAAPASASERGIASDVLRAQNKSFDNFAKAKLSLGFKEAMGLEITCVENIIAGIEESSLMTGDEAFEALLTVTIIFPFDYTVAASKDRSALIQKEDSSLLTSSKRIKKKASSAKERMLASSLTSQRELMLIIYRLRGDVNFCQIEQDINGEYSFKRINAAFESAFEGSWAPQLTSSKRFEKAQKKVQQALVAMEKIKPRLSKKALDKFASPPSFGLTMAWESQSRALSAKVVPGSRFINPALFSVPAARNDN